MNYLVFWCFTFLIDKVEKIIVPTSQDRPGSNKVIYIEVSGRTQWELNASWMTVTYVIGPIVPESSLPTTEMGVVRVPNTREPLEMYALCAQGVNSWEQRAQLKGS